MIRSRAPARICDTGGWTDTWFARHGCVCNLAVWPGAEVTVRPVSRDRRGAQVTFAVARDALLDAAVAEIDVPGDLAVEIAVTSDIPAGAATGTSASVTVALLAAMDRLRNGTMSPDEIARAAHHVETERLGRQSGVQDQLAAAHGGALFIQIDEYPHAVASHVELGGAFRSELEQRLALVYLGRPHSSSSVHEEVIESLTRGGAGGSALDDLRGAAIAMRDALVAEDLAGLGRALIANTDAQAALHGGLVSEDARAVINLARAHGALGWKVNGAGGDGGTVSVLCDRPIDALAERWSVIPMRLAPEGVRVWVE